MFIRSNSLKILQTIGLASCWLFLQSCGSMQKIAVRSTAKLLDQASKEIETEASWDFFREAAPANLKTLEGLLYTDPNNTNLLATLTKAYAGYAFGVDETLYLPEVLTEDAGGKFKELALAHYSKALNYGLRFLEQKGLHQKELFSNQRAASLSVLLDRKAKKDTETVFFLAQSLGGLINLQRTNVYLLSLSGVVKELVDWSCHHSPEIGHGLCAFFFGAYETSRPRMLGGNPEKGRELFLKGIKRYPENLLLPLAYMQFYLIPFQKKAEYSNLKAQLQGKFEAFKKRQNWSSENAARPSDYNLFNAIAKKRFELLRSIESKLF